MPPDILVLGDLAAQRDTSSPYGAMAMNWPSFGWLFGVFPRCRGTVLWRTMRCSSPAGIKTNLDDRSIFSAVAPGRNLWSGCIIVPRIHDCGHYTEKPRTVPRMYVAAVKVPHMGAWVVGRPTSKGSMNLLDMSPENNC